ncbi:flagellar FliJ family protein [Helicobacter pylori PZ5026]|uniref:flagellar export protein FliJ n=1 Tax=Helicobacter pylori TaxID=210 RepID=UPI00038D8A70|nr:flagellar export protein FliJ [Helicobacter pylori]EQD90980.1 flagellar FliJ family protein [Helicobacter pylori PZ5026]MBM0605429.1 flagellar FliJ family protein [Helicobacter pylori]MBM0612434.1 flagellar FliJ family protein [Helicobacter pylori]WQU20608.1 flagellar export protein FliJ [Helicobacter pylori]WQU32219.1 flagellar export protein FliJ [Helicobacter pylori]
MKKFASVLVQLKTLALEKIEQKLESKRLELQQNEREILDKQAQLSAFKNPELGGMSLFLQTQQLKSALRLEIEYYQQEGENLTKDLKILEKDYLLANQELEKAKIILEKEKQKEQKILEKKEQALLDENAMILHWQKEGLHA